MKVFDYDLRSEQPIDGDATFILEGLEGRVTPELLELLHEMLLGFHEDMQLIIADSLLDFVTLHLIHLTCCLSVDAVLESCYQWIAEEKGIKIFRK